MACLRVGLPLLSLVSSQCTSQVSSNYYRLFLRRPSIVERVCLARPLSGSRETRRKDYYQILGISPKATQFQVKEAYLSQSLKWHPDKNKGNEEEAHTNFTNVTEAYSVLGNYETRRKYDRRMFREHGRHGVYSTEDRKRAQTAAQDFDLFYKSHYEGVKKHKDRVAKEKKFREERQQFGDAGTQQRFIFTTVFTLLAVFLYYVRRKLGIFM